MGSRNLVSRYKVRPRYVGHVLEIRAFRGSLSNDDVSYIVVFLPSLARLENVLK